MLDGSCISTQPNHSKQAPGQGGAQTEGAACLHLCSDLVVHLKISFPYRKLGNGEQHEERRQNSPVISELVLLCPGPSEPLQNEREGYAVPHTFLTWAL